ncbi:MAG: M17 family peptidase N-terminal domain-containing protein, partial [Mycobacteriales bacterium]
MAELTFAPPTVAGLTADALVVGIFSVPDGVRLAPGAEIADEALGGRLLDALTALGATGAEDEVVKVATVGTAGTAGTVAVPLVVAAGLGKEPAGGAAPGTGAVRRAAGAATRALSGRARVASALGL